MKRRTFLAAATAAVAARGLASKGVAAGPQPNRLALSITWGMFRSMPAPEALSHLARLEYDAFEMFNWRDPAPFFMMLRALLRRSGSWAAKRLPPPFHSMRKAA